MPEDRGEKIEPGENRQLAWRLSTEGNPSPNGDGEEGHEGGAVNDSDVAPHSETRPQPPADGVVDRRGYRRRDRQQVSEKRPASPTRASAAKVGNRYEHCAQNRDPDPGTLSWRRRLANQHCRDGGDDRWLEAHQRYRCRNRREMDRRIPRPEVERERNPAQCGKDQLAPRGPAALLPVPGGKEECADDYEREPEAPDRDRNRIGAGELYERPGERDPEEGYAKHRVRGHHRGLTGFRAVHP